MQLRQINVTREMGNPPYKQSGLTIYQSKVRIEELLAKQKECRFVVWEINRDWPLPTLKFVIEVEIAGVVRRFIISMLPTLIKLEDRRQRQIKKYVDRPDISMRMLYWRLKTKLEEIKFGQSTLIKEFMPYIRVKLDSGNVRVVGTIGDLIETGTVELPHALTPGEERKQLSLGEEKEV